MSYPAVPSIDQFGASFSSDFGKFDVDAASRFLTQNEWPIGLQQAFFKNVTKIPMRFFICDNSGSMVASDGHRLIGEGARRQSIPASRWSELGDFIRFHATLSSISKATSQFRMLNNCAPITVGGADDVDGNCLKKLLGLLEDSPSGGTPLCRHITEVTAQIRAMEPFLRASNQKVTVVIATDGESSDGDMATALAPLNKLPVWVVIRLCTDEDKIVEYWNNIDKILELDLDILDDITGEAGEVCENNTWLTYGEPLHRMREFGVTIKEMDLLDEGSLSPEQILAVIRIILGGDASEYPSPYTDWRGFRKAVEGHLGTLGYIWNPLTKRATPWININKLHKHFGGGGFCTIS